MEIRNKEDQLLQQKERLKAYAKKLSPLFANKKEVQDEKRRTEDQ